MTIELSTPALLFPAISLLFLSYTNRFLALSALIRQLHDQWTSDSDQSKKIPAQIENLRYRLKLIKHMQVAGTVSLLCCVVSMSAMLADSIQLGTISFILALILMAYSLCALFREIMLSGGALNILLDEAENCN